MKTRLVVKLIAVLVLLLAVVLYKMNDFYKQEKIFQSESQIRKQVISAKTSVSSQISAVKNTISSFDVEIKENQINWVQLDPFFAIAKLQKKNDGSFSVLQYVGRSGTIGEKWNVSYLEKALSVRKTKSDKPIQARLFKDKSGAKFLALVFTSANQKQTAVVGTADYFQKYFDLERGGRMTSALVTTDHILAAHSESDYIASESNEDQLSDSKYLFEKEEIAGTNLVVVSYALKKIVAESWMIPWSVVGLIFGFGFVLIGVLIYGLDPLDKKIERYKKQERDAIFKDTLQFEIEENQKNAAESLTPVKAEMAEPTHEMLNKTRAESVEKAQAAFAEPNAELAEATINGPLQQALFNLDSTLKQMQITVEKDIQTRLTHSFYYGLFIKSFENILRNSMDALSQQDYKKITVRAYDIDHMTVVEIQDNGIGLGSLKSDIEKVWQPFFTTKAKSQHMGLGLTEALSTFRRCGGDLSIEPMQPEGALVKMIIKNQKTQMSSLASESNAILDTEINLNANTEGKPQQQPFVAAATTTGTQASIDFAEVEEPTQKSYELDLDQVLSLDDVETENIFVPQKINLKTQSEVTAKPLKGPEFSLSSKTYKVDDIPVKIRRPEKS